MRVNSRKLTSLQFKTVIRNYAAATGQDFNNVTIRNLYEQYINNVHVNVLAIAFEFSNSMVRGFELDNRILRNHNNAHDVEPQDNLRADILNVVGNDAYTTREMAEKLEVSEGTIVNYTNQLIKAGLLTRRLEKKAGMRSSYYFYLSDIREGVAV